MPTHPLTWACIIVTIIAVVAVLWPRSKRPKPQPPPRDISDRERFNAIRRDWDKNGH